MQVKKNDGSIELFDISKIIRVVRAAGLSKEQADQLGTLIQQWISTKRNQLISTRSIRDEVARSLTAIHKPAADLFVWYEKTKYEKRS